MTRRDFTPKSVADIVVSSPQSRVTLEQLTNGQYPLPANRSTVIVISGPYGSGKTCLAKLLPQAIEEAYGRSTNMEEPVPYLYVDCRSGAIGRSILHKIEEMTTFVTPDNASRHYILCDEIDNLSAAAQEELHQLTFRSSIVWIFTTNHRSRIDYRLLATGIDILLDAPKDEALATLAIQIAADYDVDLLTEPAQSIAKACAGSWRHVAERTLQWINEQTPLWETIKRYSNRSRLLRFGAEQRPIKTLSDLTPQYLDEVIFQDQESAYVAARIATGVVRPPLDQSMGILIFGGVSTGRKTLARLLPKTIEALVYHHEEPLFECDTFICREGVEGLSVIRQVSALINNAVIGNPSRLRYITLVDVEALSAGAQLDLKSLMNTRDVIFILVANEIATINPGVLDRCRQRIYMPWGSAEHRRPWTWQAAKTLFPTLSEAQIETLQRLPASGFRALLGAISAQGNAISQDPVITEQALCSPTHSHAYSDSRTLS
jgi:energy-coupling factor transporter ATP-binding protein EcfA2